MAHPFDYGEVTFSKQASLLSFPGGIRRRISLSSAIEDHYEESARAAKRSNLPVDLVNLSELLGDLNPVRGVNELHYADPKLNLRGVTKTTPLRVLHSGDKDLHQEDRWQALKYEFRRLSSRSNTGN